MNPLDEHVHRALVETNIDVVLSRLLNGSTAADHLQGSGRRVSHRRYPPHMSTRRPSTPTFRPSPVERASLRRGSKPRPAAPFERDVVLVLMRNGNKAMAPKDIWKVWTGPTRGRVGNFEDRVLRAAGRLQSPLRAGPRGLDSRERRSDVGRRGDDLLPQVLGEAPFRCREASPGSRACDRAPFLSLVQARPERHLTPTERLRSGSAVGKPISRQVRGDLLERADPWSRSRSVPMNPAMALGRPADASMGYRRTPACDVAADDVLRMGGIDHLLG